MKPTPKLGRFSTNTNSLWNKRTTEGESPVMYWLGKSYTESSQDVKSTRGLGLEFHYKIYFILYLLGVGVFGIALLKLYYEFHNLLVISSKD